MSFLQRIPSDHLPGQVRVVIEVSAGSRIKRGSRGEIEFLSPVRCPFNYGSAPDHSADDGDPADVVVLGPAMPRGDAGLHQLVGRICFVDEGQLDDKWVCAKSPLSDRDARRLVRFFELYAWCKRIAQRGRGRRGQTCFEGLERWS